MAFVAEPSAEPIPGYRLLERLGSGGFGEVWKAQAPGGLLKAVKIVHGDVARVDADGSHRAGQELQAIRRVQSIRHPYLLSIERYDIVDGRLIIVTELADGNLFDRYEQYVEKGQTGIPRALLLRYLHEVAEALDLMNGQHNLQHLDIKPQNLFLIQDHVKVADFGLVRDLGVLSATSNAVTPHYAAPETFESHITPSCDQYSLAIVYQELLTGHRPFTGSTMQQLAMQHLQAPPNLSTLPHADRPAVARALAKKPENRHPTCTALIDALMAGSAEPPQARIAARVADAPKAKERGVANINESIRRLEKKGAKPYRPETPPTMMRIRKEDVAPVVIDEPARRVAPPEVTGNGVLFPALVVGLGRTGLQALKQLRQSLCERFGSMSAMPHIKLLYIDSDPATAEAAAKGSGGSALAPDEILLTRLNRAAHYLKPRRNGRSLIEGWFDPQWLYRIPRSPAVQGQRALGRLTFGDWYHGITERFVDLLEEATDPESLARADKNAVLGVRTNRPRTYLVANLGGGTGGGTFIDVAYALRNRLITLGYDKPQVVGMFSLPPVERKTPGELQTTANTHAALLELSHFCHLDAEYLCTFDDRDAAWRDHEAPFTRIAVLPEAGAATATADFLMRDLTQNFGRQVDAQRLTTMRTARATTEACGSTFGVAALVWPRQALVRRASRKICELVVERWARRDVNSIKSAVHAWIDQQMLAEDLGTQTIVDRLKRVAQTVVNGPVDEHFAKLAQQMSPKGWFAGGLDTHAAWDVMSQWRDLLGQPESTTGDVKIGIIGEEMANAATAVCKEWGGKLAQMAVTLIEQPEFRMPGAEEAIARIRTVLDDARARHENDAHRFNDKSTESFHRAQQLVSSPSGRKAATDFLDVAKAYPTERVRALLHQRVSLICAALSEELGEQLGEVKYCRQRLDDLLTSLRQDCEEPTDTSHCLLPPGCTTIEQAVSQIVRGITENDLCELDGRMQKMMQTQFMALVHVCLSTSDMFGNLEPAMLKLATQFVAGRVGDTNAAALFFERYDQPRAAKEAIVQAFESAAPALADNIGVTVGEITALTVPPGAVGERATSLAKQALGQNDLLVCIGQDDIAFYRELPRLPLSKLPQMGPAARECYDYVADHDRAPPHTRNDVDEWLQAK